MRYFGKYIIILLINSFLVSNLYSQNKNIDSLLGLLASYSDDSLKVELLNDIAKKYYSIDLDKTREFANKAIKLGNQLDYYKGVGTAYKHIGNSRYFSGEYSKAYEQYEVAISKYEKANDKQGIATIYRNYGSVFSQLGQYENTIDYYKKSINIYIELNDSVNIANLYRNIGLYYYNLEDYDVANDYFTKALHLSQKLNNKSGIAEAYFYRGVLLIDKISKDTTDFVSANPILKDSISINLNQAYHIYNQIDDPRGIARTSESLAMYYLKNNLVDSSLQYIQKAKIIYEETGVQLGIANTKKLLGTYYQKRKNYAKAIELFTEVKNIALEIDSKALLREVYSDMAVTYKEMRNFEEAFKYINLSYTYKDTLIREDDILKAAQAESQFKFDRQMREREAEELQRQLEQEAKLNRQRMITIFFIIGFALMIGLAVVIFRSLKQKKAANALLEEKNSQLKQQQEEILVQNEMLTQQKEEIEAQNEEILIQKEKVEHANKHIKDSIVYAKRIQSAAIPPDELINSMFKEYFILFRPRDIVSGDFYWASQKGSYRFITAADCTGHGVPGAFMSMLGISLLNEIISGLDENEDIKANLILKNLREQVKKSLRQTGKENEAKDGMDIAFCIFNFNEKKLQYAGAHNSLLHIKDGELIQYKADRMPIGIHVREKENFTNHEIDLKQGDSFYFFSDGISDQFGGPDGKKFMVKRLKNLILEHNEKPLFEQQKIIENNVDEWMSYTNNKGQTYEQIDDVLLIGIKYV